MINKKIKLIITLILLVFLCSACELSDYEAPPNPEKYEVNITLDYEETFLSTNSPMNVYVDDEKLGRQEAGAIQNYRIHLEEGKYKFYLKNDGLYKTEEIEFEVTKNNCSFSFGAKTRLTFGIEVWKE